MEAHKTQGFVALSILLISFFVLLCVDSSTAQDFGTEGDSDTLPGRIIRQYITPREVATVDSNNVTEPCNTTGDGSNTCLSCITAPVCIKASSGSMLIGSYNCSDQNSSTPYCNKGVCSDKPEDTCGNDQTDTGFVCTSNGYFPDPDDCQKFHFCVQDKATDFSCSDNYVYSHQKTSCIRKILSSDCALIKCKYTLPLEYVIYPKDSSVYGLCLRGYTTVVFKCGSGETYDTKTSSCTFVCKKEGLFPVSGSKTKYRECFLIGLGKYQLYERECPSGSFFNSDIGKCDVEEKSAIIE